ncbi:MAG: hypothetical protein WAN03_19665, partial [Candidatus Sulfotelmatobacter sp.]
MTPSSAVGPDSQIGSTVISRATLAKRAQGAEFAAPGWMALLVVAIGFMVRLVPASRLFLDPDEALHNLLASQTSISHAWAAALTNA